jgi:hypothetical protein
MLKHLREIVIATAVLFAAPVLAQEKSADNMQIFLEKVRADKKLLVANNMKLTEGEAKAFWPVYDAYQKDLQQLNGRLKTVIEDYAKAYNAGPVPDDTARRLLNELLSLEESETKLKRSYVPKLEKALPMAKVARYLQLEHKVRAAIKYDMARTIPLVQ